MVGLATSCCFSGWPPLPWLCGYRLLPGKGPRARPISTSGAPFFLGAAIIALPLALIYWRRGQTITRHTIAAAQMLMGALLIHLSGGRIEMHFHVFGSLAFLAFYRDWRVLLTGTVIVAGDHFLRGMFWPYSVFGTTVASNWRWLEHAGWVVFEDLFLIRSCVQGTREIHEIAEKQAAQEQVQAGVEDMVALRTRELRLSEARKAAVLEAVLDCVVTIDENGRIVEANPAVETTLGYRRDEILGKEARCPRLSPRRRDRKAWFVQASKVVNMPGRVELPALRMPTAPPSRSTDSDPHPYGRTGPVHGLHCATSPNASMPRKPCIRPRKRPRRPTGPRANSWPT